MTTHQLFTTELRQMHWFENAWVAMLGQLGRSTCLPELGSVLKNERAYTQEHVNRLRQIFFLLMSLWKTKKMQHLQA